MKQSGTKNSSDLVGSPVDSQEFFRDLSTLPPEILKWLDTKSTNTLLIWDHSNKIIYISESVTSLLGYETDEILGISWEEKVSVEDVAFLKKQANTQTIFSQPFAVSVLSKSGKYIWCECVVNKIKSDHEHTYNAAILRDISDKKETEEMMIRSEKMSIAGQLAAGIAHEIRNPLTSIKGFLQLLQAGISHKDEYYKIMIDEIEKMESISSELLFISKPLTENKKMENVQEMIEDVVVLLKTQASLNGSKIIWHIDEGQEVYCDRSQIKQVLINLVKNAYEAMTDGGNIEIRVSSINDNTVIKIIDQGPGVSEEIIHKLDEPFFTTKQNGTGLGLMIANQILARHDGKLEVYANKEKGSTFQIMMPKHKK